MYLLSTSLSFPPTCQADENGLLAIGGDLQMQRLLLAYRSGIFPWFSQGEPICWWSPDPRFVLFPEKIHISKSMQSIMRRKEFQFSTNIAFEEVIRNCSAMQRPGQDGTWITTEMMEAYVNLHKAVIAHSAEAWKNVDLGGGLYDIRLGKVFFGESMFSKISNASKFAFIHYVQMLQKEDVQLIDCQLHTAHLESLGAQMISRKAFETLLQQYIST